MINNEKHIKNIISSLDESDAIVMFGLISAMYSETKCKHSKEAIKSFFEERYNLSIDYFLSVIDENNETLKEEETVVKSVPNEEMEWKQLIGFKINATKKLTHELKILQSRLSPAQFEKYLIQEWIEYEAIRV